MGDFPSPNRGSDLSKRLIGYYEGKPVKATQKQIEKIEAVLHYVVNKNYPLTVAIEQVAKDKGINVNGVYKVIYHKNLKSFIKELIKNKVSKIPESVNDKPIDVKTVRQLKEAEEVISIRWVIANLKELYDSVDDDNRLKKDILMALAKLSSNYSDALSNDLKRMEKMTLMDLIKEIVNTLVELSAGEFEAGLIEELLNMYKNKLNENIMSDVETGLKKIPEGEDNGISD